jgi:hypothetical protein
MEFAGREMIGFIWLNGWMDGIAEKLAIAWSLLLASIDQIRLDQHDQALR